MENEQLSLSPVTAGEMTTAELMKLVYSELRALAGYYLRRERPGHTLQPTALVHEVFLRLSRGRQQSWVSRAQFLSVAAAALRRILVDHARSRGCVKRQGTHVDLPDDLAFPARTDSIDLLALDEALDELERRKPRQAKVVELRFFGGLTAQEAANVLGISVRSADDDWRKAKEWLWIRLEDGAQP
ncbi:MAG: sigma-70 family RNA polymerase sigma factor [Planctomycetes bacterium]|nr:sigma-70 family RNA polymerase sigma factor [Planctomycetota bacterium]MBI3847849.1 sigma-70 family RNA polymerase sigma factor [Planctomycetota bacterium]